MITIKQEIEVVEVDDKDVTGDGIVLKVNSHWNDAELVVIQAGRRSYTVNGDELISATQNAMNSEGA